MDSSPPRSSPPRQTGDADALQAAMERAGLDDAAQAQMVAWLGEQLAEERYAQLDRAGHDPRDRIPLARVLIDLPISRSSLGRDADDPQGKTVLAAVCAEDPELFDLPSEALQFVNDVGEEVHLGARRAEWRRVPRHGGSASSRGIVLVGGPGQGKSTITQSLSALHHAGLLGPHAGRLDGPAREALTSIQAAQKWERGGAEDPVMGALPIPATARLPLRILLPEAAVWLLENEKKEPQEIPLLLQFVAERAATGHVPPETLRKLVSEMDWLVIFDGLDEVPASEARAKVLSEARLLLDHLHEYGRAGQIVATTRPQGYGGELSGWTELCVWHLVSLSPQEAETYARRLVNVRYEAKRGERILARFAEAAGTAATARLLGSPLQVTILVALIGRIGRAPGERWTLFSEYYRIIYEREMERELPAAEHLRKYRALIDRIHMHVGLLLQVESEQAGGADATMTTARLRDVMHAVFAEQGMDAARRQPVIEGLLAAITERLVLLVEKRAGRVGFEIRPLQELMAAWALSQKETQSEARLARVARSDAFREVVLFLASKAFAELSDVRDVLVDRVLPGLNEDPEEPLAAVVLRGSVLAVEVLADGAALSQPKYVERLAALGMRLVDLPLDERLPQLARACMSDEDAAAAAVPVWMEGIRKKLDAGGVPEERIAAWGLLIALVDEGSEDARRLADERWAGDAAVEDGRALRRSRSPSGSSWLSDAVGRDVERFAPEVVLSPWSFGAGAQRVALMTLLAGHGSRKTAFVTDGDGAGLLMLLWHTLGRRSDGYGDLVRLEGRSPKWRLVKASAVLLMEPNRQRLAEVLQAIATVGLEAARDLPDGLFPWPVMACLNSAVTAADMERFASQAASGELGDAADWLALEDRVAQGQRLGLEEMRAHRWEEWPLDADLGSASMLPFVAARAISNGIRSAHLTADAAQHRSDQIAGLAARLHEPGISPQAARTLARVLPLLVEASHRLGAVPRLSPGDVRRISALAEQLPVSMLAAILPHISLESDWIDLLDDLGRSEKTASRAYFESGLAELLLDALNEAPDKTGLLRLLGRLATFAAIPGTGDWRIDPDRYSDPRDRDAALALQVLWGAVSESEARQARMFVSGGTEDFPAAELVRIVSRSPDLSLQRGLLEVLSTSIPRAEYDALDRLVHVARPLVGKVPSNLEDPAVWDSLQLPMPRPERRSPSDRAPASSGDRRPVAIERMAFRNFRGIEELQITPAPPQNGHGQWIVLLGKNGLGKTTILRGLALSLVEIDEPVRRPLPPTAYNAAWRRIGTPEEQPSFVRVKLRGGDHEHGAEIRAREDLLAQEQLAPLGKPPSEMVLVYGSHRRYVVSDAKRTVVEDVSALVPSLFEEGADLLPLEETLVKMAAAHLSEPGTTEARLHGELTAALAKLLRLQAVELRGQQIWVRGSDNVDVPLKELSDGYLTLAAWVVDLVARWWFQAKRWKIEPSGPILPFMTGVVLVDEIDLFLHPDWQRSVVRSLREIFPRMTFVVTTHNPLAILGARAAEIWILRKDDSGKAVAEQRDLEPFRLTGSDLYDFYFGIESALPDELGQMLRRYEQLAGDPYRSAAEDDEVRALLGKLRAKDVDPGWEPVALEAPPAAEGEGA